MHIWGYATRRCCFCNLLWWQRFSGHLGLMLYLGLGSIGFLDGHQAAAGNRLPAGAGAGSRGHCSVGAILEACRSPVVLVVDPGPRGVHFAVIVGIATVSLFIRWVLVHHLARRPADLLKVDQGSNPAHRNALAVL